MIYIVYFKNIYKYIGTDPREREREWKLILFDALLSLYHIYKSERERERDKKR